MTCCGGNIAADGAVGVSASADFSRAEELLHAGRERNDGTVEYVFSAPDIHCGACISSIERAIRPMHGVAYVRVNLSLRRVTVHLDPAATGPIEVAGALAALGFPARPVDLGDLDELERKRRDSELLKSLAVAGFASANIMLLSVSVWSGAEGATRDLFHLISALIAIPAVFYAGQVFFRSAWGALRNGRVNMDVPISLAISLATGMSLFEALTGGDKTYFEAATMLLFFLLIGRYLDQRMRERVRTAVVQLSRLSAKGANVLTGDGEMRYLPLDEIEPGMTVRVFAGERLPVDGTVETAASGSAWPSLAGQMRANAVRPEIEIFDLSHLHGALRLVEAGLIDDRPHVQFVMGVKNAMPADPHLLDLMLGEMRRILPRATWTAAGIGRHQAKVMDWALARGAHAVRTGLEDNIRITRERLASGNAELVALAAEVDRRVHSVRAMGGSFGENRLLLLAALLEKGAKVEIEVTAVLPD